MESIEMTWTFRVPPDRVYNAWMSSEGHAAMTEGGLAEVEPRVNGRFTAWDGYIKGVTLELVPGKKILQSWRTTDFAAEDRDSRLEILLIPEGPDCVLKLLHTGIPAGQSEDYRQGWIDYYFKPMEEYFGK